MEMLPRDSFRVVRQNFSGASVQEEYIVELCCTKPLHLFCRKNDNSSCINQELQIELLDE